MYTHGRLAADFIGLLLDYDLIEISFKIFSHLDGKSLANCRLVCHTWNSFIDFHFFEKPKGTMPFLKKARIFLKSRIDIDFRKEMSKTNVDFELFKPKIRTKN